MQNIQNLAAALPLLLLALSGAGCGDGSEISSIACEVGAPGCPCAQGDVCAPGAAGEALVCQDQICVSPRCPAGSTGCVCAGGSACSADGDVCSRGVCKPGDCIAGTSSCDCLGGVCDAGLYCNPSLGNGTCVDDAGYPGGRCLDNGLCLDASRCDRDLQICVRCGLGSQGCLPDEGRCNVGLVLSANRCLAPVDVPPTDPVCYTACRADYVTEEETRPCPPSGVMQGCVGLFECIQGSCLLPDSVVPTCDGDLDCPSFQTCMQDGAERRCYSNCNEDLRCPTGYACHDQVCRVPCVVAQSAAELCPSGSVCDSADGTTGVCMPSGDGANLPDPPEGPHAAVTLSRTHVLLAGSESSVDVRVATDSPRDETFELVRVGHRAYDFAGNTVQDTWSTSNTAVTALPFVTLEVGARAATEITVPAGCADTATCPAITLGLDPTRVAESWARWDGLVELRHPRLGVKQITVAQLLGGDGTWTGEATYFAAFPDPVGLGRLRDAAMGSKAAEAAQVQNALIGAGWAAYRSGVMQGAFEEMRAMLDTAAKGSWQWASVQDACLARDPAAEVCYLYDDGVSDSGVRTWYTRSQGFEMPTGVGQLPVSLHLRSANQPGSPYALEGVFDSSVAMHYGGFPAVQIAFEADPMADGRCLVDAADGVPGDCVTFLTAFDADIWVGSRAPAAPGACPTGGTRAEVPWLLEDFTAGSGAGAGPTQRECRDVEVPFLGEAEANASWSLANPIPDGRRILREVRLIDGALINQGTLFVLFEERFHTGFRDGGFVAYGYLLLERTEHAPKSEDFETRTTPDATNTAVERATAACSQALLTELGRGGASVSSMSPDQLSGLAARILRGVDAPAQNAYPMDVVHYLCEDTGHFDGGPDASNRLSCPQESNVTFFVLEGAAARTPGQMAAEPCQSAGSCAATLNRWTSGTANVAVDPAWRCAGDGNGYCSADRHDLRTGKTFFRPVAGAEPPIGTQLEEAFRYRTRFTSPTGRTVGFAPVTCGAGAGQTPYCYDPEAIEAIADRAECLLAIYEAGVDANNRDAPRWLDLRRFLEASFVGFGSDYTFGAQPDQQGFERLYAELLVMLGDEAYTQALRSRFDLASTNGADFSGSAFEPGGMDLSGLPGYEMRSLYRATQYYQTVLDRFYRVSAPVLHTALDIGDEGAAGDVRVVRPSMPTVFLERLIGASTKLTRAWSEVARRYQGFNRPDLARKVLERAFTRAHIESVVLSQLMLEISEGADPEQQDMLRYEIETAKLRYRVALAEMRDIYSSLTDDISFFGFAPDYVPFPAVDLADQRTSNAFEAVMFTARRRMDTARRLEDEAIQSDRAFESDAASFQSELARIRISHEQRLSQVCGAFVGADGQVHPAVPRYRHLAANLTSAVDPCGLLQNGELYDQAVGLQILVTEREALHRRLEHLAEREQDQKERVIALCDHLDSTADRRQERQRKIRNLNIGIGTARASIATADRVMNHVGIGAQLSAEGLAGYISAGFYAGAAIAHVAVTTALEGTVIGLEAAVANVEIEGLRDEAIAECQALMIEAVPNLNQLRRDAELLSYDAQELTHRFARTLGDIERLYLEAQRIQEEQRESEQLAINVEAARNDPNIRIYRNAAVINADRSFYRALQYAYRATLMFEYFTSQSYADREQLFLTRMVGRGYYNLENYLDELEDAYEYFRERYRTRARRVEVISLRDDVFRAALNKDTGATTVTEQERSFHESLTDPRRLNAHGHIDIPFRTNLDQVSPCTFSHQIDFIEVWFQSATASDYLAEVMVWQEGTGVIANLAGTFDYYQLPPALLVAHPFFNNAGRHFDPSVYRRYELRERPYVNTSWRLVYDAFGNPENADLDLSRLTDIKLYVYYTDFTDPERCR